jgi:hypothetical protein
MILEQEILERPISGMKTAEGPSRDRRLVVVSRPFSSCALRGSPWRDAHGGDYQRRGGVEDDAPRRHYQRDAR